MMIFIYCCSFLFFLLLSFSKKKNFFKYGVFNKSGYLELKKTILNYGYNYSITTHITSICFFIAILGFMCLTFEVRIETFLLLSFIVIFIFPHILIWIMFHSYQEKVFNNFTLFLQNFIAVYKLNPKTYLALCECEKVCDGEVKDLIQKMKINLLSNGSINECMQILLDYQPHFIVHNLTSLICTIEEHGGTYCDGLDLIQDDIDDWIEDIYDLKKKQVNTKNKMMGLCIMSLGIAYVAKNMLSDVPFDTHSELYQFAVFIFMSCILFTIFMAHRVFSKSWFEKEEQL